jgi:ribonuclease P protein component
VSDGSFSKSSRLLKTADFDRVFARRNSRGDGLLVVYACENELNQPRLGLVVSRKIGSAVERNRWKRCLREAFRLLQRELPPLDFVVMPKRSGAPTTQAVSDSLRNLANRLSKQDSPRHPISRTEPR